MKQTLLFLSFFLSALILNAQDFPFGVLDRNAMLMSNYSKDTNAAAVVLREFGTARISDRDGRLVFQYHVKIKVFDSQKFSYGDVAIPLYKSDANRFETISSIRGIVFYQDSDRGVKQMELEKKDIFHEKTSKHVDLVKFALPNVRDGSVLEYQYEIESPYVFNFRPWTFQWDIPKVHSEFVAVIPGVYTYNVTLIGPHKLTKTDAVRARECFVMRGTRVDCSKMTYIMNDIPAFLEEDYMTSSKNYLSAINFELAEIDYLRGGKQTITKDWKDIDYQLKRHTDFGRQVRRDELFKNRLPDVLANTNSELEKAEAIYDYIKGLFKWNEYNSIFSEEGIKKALEKRSGNVGDINLALVAALSAAGIDVDPVVLSTRSNGTVNKLYPIVSDFNYVIAKVNIGNESYFLDATDPLLPFGLLPLRCINDQGRVMSIDKPSYWVDLVASQKRGKVFHFDLALQDDGKITGTMKNYSTGYEALSKRKKIKGFNTIEEYVENLDEGLMKMSILNHEIENVDSLKKILGETYEVEINAYDDLESDHLYFNPFLDRLKENPFKLAERTYPVDMGAPLDSKVIITMSFPESYEIVSKPEDRALGLPNNGGRFVSKIDIVGNKLHLSESVQLNRSIYHPEEYHYLKELFNQILLLEKTDIVFKKKL